MVKCPYCGRKIIENERYCYFCHQNIGKHVDKAQRIGLEPKPYGFKDDINKIKSLFKKGTNKEEIKIFAYCVKCNNKVIVKNPKIYIMKNNRRSIKGTCPFCSRKVFRVIGMAYNKKK